MRGQNVMFVLCVGILLLIGCGTQRIMVNYDQLEKTNAAEVTLTSGNKLTGTVVKAEPHQITMLMKDRKLRQVPKSSIRSVSIKPPIRDDLGRGIAEEEIASVKTNKNAVVYGIGGGALSMGAGFFVGSMIGKNSDSGGSILAATTLGGGGLGTWLFVRAGKAKDWREAIAKIREKRILSEQKKEEPQTNSNALRKQLEDEKRKQEELRKEREKLLRELQGKKKKEIEE